MKIVSAFFVISTLLLSNTLYAKQDESANMMKQMADVQNCMMQLDFQEMDAMEEKSKTLETQINTLCASGDEAGAKEIAIKFSDEVMNSNTMQAMKKCVEGMPGMEEQFAVADFRQELEQKSICDVVNNR
jgi:predicted lipoprotein